MSEIISVIKGLPQLSSVAGASKAAIADAEIQLRLSFAEEYKEYLAEFGSIAARGIELTGIIDAEYCHVVSATKQEWELNPKVPHTMYVVENTFVDGRMIWQDTGGAIYQSSPNSGPRKIADSLAEYLRGRSR